jgi:hypothetical protein
MSASQRWLRFGSTRRVRRDSTPFKKKRYRLAGGRWEHGNKATCSSVPAEVLDRAVSEKILSIMKPSELELSLKVMHNICDANRLSDKQWLLAIERAQYESNRAERQFMLADPENRLVVRSLETNWNQKLKELEKAKQDYAAYSSKKAWIPSKEDEQNILDLAHKIPVIWNAPSSTPKEKKRIIRILIEDITVLSEKKCSDLSIGIRFRSGKLEQLALKKPLPCADRKRHTDDTLSHSMSIWFRNLLSPYRSGFVSPFLYTAN